MKGSIIRIGSTLAVALAMVVFLASCGGGEGSTVVTPPPPPPPAALTITTTSLPGSFYSEFYSTTLQASGGVGARTWSITQGTLPVGLNLDHARGVISGVNTFDATGTITFDVRVQDSASPPSTVTRTFDIQLDQRAARFLTASLPDAVIGRPYRVRLATTQPSNPITVIGLLPPGLAVDSPNQTIAGRPTGPAASFSFVVQIGAGSPPVERTYTINVVGTSSGNRNEDIAHARQLSSGTYSASISPFVDPVTAPVPTPDNDYYRLTAQPVSTVSIEIFAERNFPRSPLDSVIELVDSAGIRLSTCDSPGQSGFTNSCLDDDNVEEGTLDSKLTFRAPGGAPTTFFLHVLDWRGDGRPDMLYDFQIIGAD